MEHVILYGIRDLADMVKFSILRCGEYPDYPHGHNESTSVLIKGGRGSESERGTGRCYAAGIKYGIWGHELRIWGQI